MPIPEVAAPTSAPLSRRRAYTHRYAPHVPHLIALYARLNRSGIDCVVLQRIDDQSFVIVPKTEFQNDWAAT